MKKILVTVIVVAATSAAADVQAPPDTFLAAAATGPGDSVKALCEGCTTMKLQKVKLKAPYQKLGLAHHEDPDTEDNTVFLTVQLDGKTYLAPLGSWTQEGANSGSVDVTSVKLKDVIPGGALEVLLTGSTSEMKAGHEGGDSGQEYKMLWVCGLGATGAPSCAAVPLGITVWPHEYGEGKKYRIKVTHKFTRDGRITRKVKGKWPSERTMGDVVQDRSEWQDTRSFLFP